MEAVYPKRDDNPRDVLARCGGFYACPKDSAGKRLGPLVGYAARYDGEHQWVGDMYVNFAKAERHGRVLDWVAEGITDRIARYDKAILERCTGFCGAPEGGKALANALAISTGKQYIFPEKRILKLKTGTSREVSELCFDRHEPEQDESWWIVEDVCNNFSTTEELFALIRKSEADVEGIICFLDRSTMPRPLHDLHQAKDGTLLPVISLVRHVIEQYRQDDPFVAEDVASGNVVWKPKTGWNRLAAAMKAAGR